MLGITKTLRFTIPPFIFLFFIILAEIFIPEVETTNAIIRDVFSGDIQLIVTSTTGIIAVGFLITTLASVLVKLFKWQYPKWQRRDIIKELYAKIDSDIKPVPEREVKNEFLEWLVQSEAPKNIQENIQKRWEWFHINFGSLIALIFSMIYLLIFNAHQINIILNACGYIIITLCFLAIFLYNAISNKDDVYKIDNLVLDFYSQMIKKYPKYNQND